MSDIKELEQSIKERLEEILKKRDGLIKGLNESGTAMANIYSVEIVKCDAAYEELDELLDYINESFQ